MTIKLSTLVRDRDEDFAGLNLLDANNNLSDVNSASASLVNLGLTATAAELNTLDGITATTAQLNFSNTVTSNIQTQIDSKQDVLTGAATTIANSDLTTARVLVSDGSGKVAAGDVTTTELGYIDGLTLGTSAASKVVTADANGDVNLTEELTAKSYNETYVGLSGTTPDVNCEAGNLFALTTSGNSTFTFSNPPASGTGYGMTIAVTAGGTHTITWPTSVDWAGGTTPDAPALGETDVYTFFTRDGGTTWYGFQAGDALQ